MSSPENTHIDDNTEDEDDSEEAMEASTQRATEYIKAKNSETTKNVCIYYITPSHVIKLTTNTDSGRFWDSDGN